MPIDPSKALGAELGAGTASWEADDVILYNLGIGRGATRRPTRVSSNTPMKRT